MKLMVQIPCFHEEQNLEPTLRDIPREIPGVDSIEILIIDDGSADRTTEVARNFGVNHIYRMRTHRGLARAFQIGLQQSIKLGADIIVNLDADNQYEASMIPKLIAPIRNGTADITLGARDFSKMPEFSTLKRFFQVFGSRVISWLCHVSIPDAATGFRAFSREAAQKTNVFTRYTYTLETLIQASHEGLKVVSIPIRTNPPVRSSRLIKHPILYVIYNSGAVIRLAILYNSLRVFGLLSFSLLITGALELILSSRVWGAGLIAFATLLLISGLILDQISVNRRLLESIKLKLSQD